MVRTSQKQHTTAYVRLQRTKQETSISFSVSNKRKRAHVENKVNNSTSSVYEIETNDMSFEYANNLPKSKPNRYIEIAF